VQLSRSTVRKTAGQLGRFAATSGASAVVTLGLPVLLHEVLAVEPKVAVAISQCFVILMNFLILRLFVFRSRRGARRDLVYYLGSALGFRATEYLLFLSLFELVGLHYFLALLLTLGTSTIVKFFWYRILFEGAAERNC
jgi:putative flippase GtrA